MTKRFFAVVCICLLVFAISLVSCSEYTDDLDKVKNPSNVKDTFTTDTYEEDFSYDPNNPQCQIGQYTGCMYDDKIFYLNYINTPYQFMYQSISDIKNEGMLLHNDILSEDEDNPFANIYSRAVRFLIDEEATLQNDGNPVLILYFQQSGPKESHKIVSYDTNTGKTTIIKEIKENMQSLFKYGDYLYYTTNEGDLGYNVHRINKDGTDYLKMPNPDKGLYMLGDIYKDRIYMYDMKTLQITSTDLSFENKEVLVSNASISIEPFVVNDCIVYTDMNKSSVLLEERNMAITSSDIYMQSLTDPNKVEKILEGVHVGMRYKDKFYYYLTNPRTFNNGQADMGTNILYEYSFDTGKSRIVYDLGDKEIVRYYMAFSDKYIIYDDRDYESDELAIYMTVQNRKTGEERRIPY